MKCNEEDCNGQCIENKTYCRDCESFVKSEIVDLKGGVVEMDKEVVRFDDDKSLDESLDEFEKASKEGKVCCISDLMIKAGM